MLLTLPILAAIRDIEGWLEDDEADLLISATREAIHTSPDTDVLEIGSYCGKSTVAIALALKSLHARGKLYAVDPHEGDVGAEKQRVQRTSPTFARFSDNLRRAEVTELVVPVQQRSFEYAWERPTKIGFLFIDGLHDYDNVRRDFLHFEPHLHARALIAFHDYAPYYPGVVAAVDELVASSRYVVVARARSLTLIQRPSAIAEQH